MRCDDCQFFRPPRPEIEERPVKGKCEKDNRTHKADDHCEDFRVWTWDFNKRYGRLFG